MVDSRDKIPTSRVGRTARLGSLAAGQAVKQAGTRAANLTRGEEASELALSKRQIDTARQIVTALGTMKGAAMKIGQVMSFLDFGLVPEEHREEFQAKLAELRDSAPKVSFKEMRVVIEEELEDSVDEIFAEFDQEPIAAASIGQVYRAKLHDGRDVAVKVQYPGVASAVRSDMKNLGLILRLMKRVAPGMDSKAIGKEITERIDEELDYELEAQNQRSLARIFRDHPFIYVPDVITRLSRERVVVSEFVEGIGFEKIRKLGKAKRDHVGEIVFRFFFSCLYKHHQFSGDPHPGNFKLMDDGRVGFLDFGLFKRMQPTAVELEIEVQRASMDGDAERLTDLFVESGFISKREKFAPEELLDQFRGTTWWYSENQKLALTPEIATQVMIDMSDPRSRYFDKMRHETLPADHLFGRRMEMLTLAVLGQLRAEANWFEIAREWFFNDPPKTKLGREEAKFYG